jgi:hypothetical protein
MNKIAIKRNSSKKGQRDSGNHEGFMINSNEEFQLLVKTKAVKSFMKEEAQRKPAKLDLMLTRLYLAL